MAQRNVSSSIGNYSLSLSVLLEAMLNQIDLCIDKGSYWTGTAWMSIKEAKSKIVIMFSFFPLLYISMWICLFHGHLIAVCTQQYCWLYNNPVLYLALFLLFITSFICKHIYYVCAEAYVSNITLTCLHNMKLLDESFFVDTRKRKVFTS